MNTRKTIGVTGYAAGLWWVSKKKLLSANLSSWQSENPDAYAVEGDWHESE